MLIPNGFQLIEQLSVSAASFVVRATDMQSQASVILKTCTDPHENKLEKLRHEADLLGKLSIDNVIELFDVITCDDNTWLVLEDIEGISLSEIMEASQVDLIRKIDIAMQIIKTIGELHEYGVIHKDINPSNIIYNEKSGKIRLIDFGLATQFSTEQTNILVPVKGEGTLAYIAPEQTGRMNRLLDYRVDLYSFGVTCYQLFSGELPFYSNDAMELIYAHIAKDPVSIDQINLAIPRSVAAIVEKLMQKNAEDRYKSAYGVYRDFSHCIQMIRENILDETFVPGLLDHSGRLIVPQKLFGRDSEISTLLKSYHRVTQKNKELIVIKGFPGIGKTRLVEEIIKSVSKQKGHFIKGNCDKLQQRPYVSILDALREIVLSMYSWEEDTLTTFCERLHSYLGGNEKLIADVIPELSVIIGNVTDVPELPPLESKNRFRETLKKFIKIFLFEYESIVIFLDNIQWVDEASCQFISSLLIDVEVQNLLLIVAYRDGEVSSGHNWLGVENYIKCLEIPVVHISLSPLKYEAVIQLLSETLDSDEESVKDLALLINEKTAGNPFYINNFIQRIHLKKLLEFDFSLMRWCWDFDGIHEETLAENIVDAIAEQLNEISKEVKYILQLGSCLGREFDAKSIELIHALSMDQIKINLLEAVNNKLIVPVKKRETVVYGNNFKFSHDKIYHITYQSINECECKNIHLNIARIKYAEGDGVLNNDQLFNIVDHYNKALSLVVECSERKKLCILNNQAGVIAQKSGAYQEAKAFFQIAVELLDDSHWSVNDQMSILVHRNLAEALCMTGEHELMNECVDTCLSHITLTPDKIPFYELKIQSLVYQNKRNEALELTAKILLQLGIEIPAIINEQVIKKTFSITLSKLKTLGYEEIYLLPPVSDSNFKCAINVVGRIFGTLLLSSPKLMAAIVAKMIELSLHFGLAPVVAPLLATFGAILCRSYNDYENGYLYGKLAIKLLDKENFEPELGKTAARFYFVIHHWKCSISESLSDLQYAHLSALEYGDLEYCAITAEIYSINCFVSGLPINILLPQVESLSNKLSSIGQEILAVRVNSLQQLLLNLNVAGGNQTSLSGDKYSESEDLPKQIENKDSLGVPKVFFYKTILCFIFGNYNGAIESISCAYQHIKTSPATTIYVCFLYFEALSRLALIEKTKENECLVKADEINTHWEQVRDILLKMKEWADSSPKNYLHKYRIIFARVLYMEGDYWNAVQQIELSIQSAKASKVVYDYALALEFASHFWSKQGNHDLKQYYFEKTLVAYKKWGAHNKVACLLNNVEEILEVSTPSRGLTTTTSSFGSTSSLTGFDMKSIIDATQIISREVDVMLLVDRVVDILLKNSGAEQIIFLLREDDVWKVYKIKSSKSSDHNIYKPTSLDQVLDNIIPKTVVNYVKKTNKAIILDNAIEEGQFTNDACIKNNQLRSVACVPVVHKSKLTAMLLLQSCSIKGLFTKERCELVEVLITQAGIALENAKLYSKLKDYSQNLEKKVDVRTNELKQSISALKQTQKKLVESEKMAALGSVVAGVAHEINTPLGICVTSVSHLSGLTRNIEDLLKSEELTEEEFINYINNSNEGLKLLNRNLLRANQLVNNFKKISVDQSNEMREIFNLSEYVNMVISALSPKLKNFPVKIENQIDAAIELDSYPGAFYQIISNLVFNSLFHGYDKNTSGIICLYCVVVDNNRLQLHYKDDGKGIPVSIQTKIFEPFFTTNRGQGGVGLGLHIVYNLVTQLLHGELELCGTEKGGGAHFCITIPLSI